MVPAAAAAAFLWAVAYALLGVVSGGIFANPLVATLLATLLVLLLGGVLNLVAARRRRRRTPPEPHHATARPGGEA
jgi:membrane protein DedA with SNARE-associated domain